MNTNRQTKKDNSVNSDIFLVSKIDFDLITLVRPGFYEIKHLPSGKRYIGETQNTLERLGKHVAILQKGIHDCLPLQADWDKEKLIHNLNKAFSLKVFDYVPKGDSKLRKKQEIEYLLSRDPLTLYNVVHDKSLPQVKRENFRKIIHIKGLEYNSIRQAALALQKGETSIRRWINNPNLTDCYLVETIKHGYKRCVVDGVEYPSITSLVDAGLAPTLLFAVRRLSSPNFPNWHYLDIDKNPLRTVQKKSFARPCLVDRITYPSVRALIIAGVATSRNFAERRLKSPEFKNWQYL